MTVTMETGENCILSPLIYKWGGRSDHLSLIAKMWWFYEENLQHHVWLCTLKGGLSLKSEFCSLVFLPWSLPEKRLVLASGPGPGGQGFTSSHSCDWQQVLHVCFSPVSSAALICSLSFPVFSVVPLFFFFLFLPPFLFMQISFFASLLPRPLHRAGCPTSLTSAVCLFSSWPWFFLFTSCLRARYTLCFLLYRSSSLQCKINTM